MSTSKELKNQSRRQWETRLDQPTDQQLMLGCLQRIADSLENMNLLDRRVIRLEQEIHDIKFIFKKIK